MSNSDSFIDEVSEEVRRDRLYTLLRRYGWIAVLVVVLAVGAAAFSEYRKAEAEARAQATGDAMLAALEADADAARAEALAQLDPAGESAAVVGLATAAAQQEAGEVAAAIATLDRLAADAQVPVLYRDLAALKSLMLQAGTTDPADRMIALEALAAPGAPFRLLAREQIAHAQLAAGETAAAIATLREIAQDAEATRGLRDRAEGLIVALGGDAVAAPAAAEAGAEDAAPGTQGAADGAAAPDGAAD